MTTDSDLQLKSEAEMKARKDKDQREQAAWVAVCLCVLGWVILIGVCCTIHLRGTLVVVSILMIGAGHVIGHAATKK